jgi:hypothetical protein
MNKINKILKRINKMQGPNTSKRIMVTIGLKVSKNQVLLGD